MSLADVVATVKSGVFHIVYLKNGIRVGSGTAFSSWGYLVTNHHVAQRPADCQVWIRREGDRRGDGVRMPCQEFQLAIVTSSDRNNYDFAVLRLPEVIKRPGTHSFTLKGPEAYRVGDAVSFLGYPLEHENLVCHSGTISSFYRSGPARTIQLDASVNPSNSGGPLIDPTTGEVLGIVTRKATGLTMCSHPCELPYSPICGSLNQAQPDLCLAE